MTNSDQSLFAASPQELAIDPDVLASELEAELQGDPLDDIEPDNPDADARNAAQECDAALAWLTQGHQERLQGLRVLCEHRDPRAIPLLLPLMEAACPIERMSAVYALGRNPSPLAVEPLLHLLQVDSNAYVRKATAWSLANYADSPVLTPLIRALQTDVAAVRLWAAGSLAEAGTFSSAKADPVADQLLMSLRIDSEPVVRSNCIWSLGRLYEHLAESRQLELIEAFVNSLLHDRESSVRDEARTALEQLEDPLVVDRLQTLLDEGLLI